MSIRELHHTGGIAQGRMMGRKQWRGGSSVGEVKKGSVLGQEGVERWYPLVRPDADNKIKDASR